MAGTQHIIEEMFRITNSEANYINNCDTDATKTFRELLNIAIFGGIDDDIIRQLEFYVTKIRREMRKQ